MTIENAVKRIRAVSAGQTNKSAPIANPLVADLCDALWAAGQYPQIKLLVENLPHLHQRAVTPGFHAWRKARNLHLHYPRWANPFIGGAAALAAMVSPEIAKPHSPYSIRQTTAAGPHRVQGSSRIWGVSRIRACATCWLSTPCSRPTLTRIRFTAACASLPPRCENSWMRTAWRACTTLIPTTCCCESPNILRERGSPRPSNRRSCSDGTLFPTRFLNTGRA